MKEQLITFETAKLAKEKGFDVYCETAYVYRYKEHESEDYWYYWKSYVGSLTHDPLTCDIGAPTQSLLQKWLREKHNTFISVDVNYCYKIYFKDVLLSESINYNNYEDALEVGLQEGLKLI
jgi:hypothetical protein